MDKRKTLKKLEQLHEQVNHQRRFKSKDDFLVWAAKVEPLLSFNVAYQDRFRVDLNMIHTNLSSQTAEPLANRMRTTLLQAIEQLKHELDTTDQPQGIKIATSSKEYIHPERIKELRGVASDKYDLCKLLKLCEELNAAYLNNSVLSIILLTRTLIDHVPPIFDCRTFNEVVNNYQGTKSFKESMGKLNSSSRTIADQHLHTPVRKSESVPTMNQVDFSNDIDVLLAEVYRISKRP
ncbi:MAG: hypothetical protein LLF28_04995 [Nitrospiraceae bacterium]|nr:hypothetical protein [Nitrospiraceae bacterium]